MLGDIGTILMVIAFPKEMGDILKAATNGGDRAALEQACLGFTVQEVSAELANKWRFPSEIVAALRWKNTPDKSDGCPYAYLLHLSSYIQFNRHEVKTELLCENFPMDIAAGAGLNTAKALADIEDVLNLDMDAAGLVD